MKLVRFFIIMLFLFVLVISGCSRGADIQFPDNGDFSNVEEQLEKQLFNRFVFNRFDNTSGSKIDGVFEVLTGAVVRKDAEAIRDMFSNRVVLESGDMDRTVQELLELVDGEVITYHRYGPGTYTSKDGDKFRKEIEASFDLETTEGFYKVALKICVIDTVDPDNVGICSLYITGAEKTDTSVYWGEDPLKQGIFIED